MGALTLTLVLGLVLVMAMATMVVDGQQFTVVHSYAHHVGSPANSRGQGQSPEYSALLKAHDRRRLASVADFPLRGDDDPTSIGLYFTRITLGTPPRQFYVQVDTGSDILWVNCAPCPGCPLTTDIDGITLQHYDPSLSTTVKVLGCSDTACSAASEGAGNGACTTVGGTRACAYETRYGDGSSTQGYFVNDILTYRQVDNSSSNGTASIYFGCGTTQSGNLLTPSRAVDGLMGLGQAQIAVPTQLAAQGKVGRVFAHCLQGDNQGGGTFVIGNILEPNISYTPIILKQGHYNVGLENIAVNGVNITDPSSFEISPSGGGGVIVDSGTTLSYLVEPAYTAFLKAITSGAPVASQQIPDSGGSNSLCWVYSGDIASTFPSVRLFFDGAVIMNLAPRNYLYAQRLTNGGSAWCISWATSTSYTILGENVLKDQLVVYDNEKGKIGWKPFDCTKSIRVSAPNSTTPMDVLPGSGDGFSAGATTRLTTIAVSSYLAFALLCTLLHL